MKSPRVKSLVIGLTMAIFITASLGVADEKEQVIRLTAKRFEYSPKEITLNKGMPVLFEFGSMDRMHGFSCPGLKIRTDIYPKKQNLLRFVPEKAGTFPFHCDNFCGTGHDGMVGTIIVKE